MSHYSGTARTIGFTPPPRYSLLVSICLALSFSLGLSLLPVAPVVAQSAPHPDYADALWLSANTGLRKLATSDGTALVQLPAETTLQPLALDGQRGRVWSYGANTLKAVSFAGQVILTVPVPPVGGGGDDDDEGTSSSHLAVNAASGNVWLGRNTQLLHLNASGQVLQTLTLPAPLRALAVDPVTARLWVATTSSVRGYTEQGVVVSTLALGTNPTVRTVAVDEQSGAVWVALSQRLRRYTTTGTQTLDLALSGQQLNSDGEGGVWLTTSTRLQRRSLTGQSLVDVALPSSGDDDSPSVVALVADPVEHTVWLAQRSTLRLG